MSGVLVFVPVDRDQAGRLVAGEQLEGLQAFCVNQALLSALELASDDPEDAEHGAMVLASLYALARHGERIVLVAEAQQATVQAGEEAHNGGVRLARLTRAQVQSFFTDADDAPVAEAAEAAHALSVDEAWELAQVQRLLGGCDLLWHSVDELGTLVERA